MSLRLALAGGASLVVHAVAVFVMMPHEPGAGQAPGTEPSFEVEMVDQAAAVRGSAAAAVAEESPQVAAPHEPGAGAGAVAAAAAAARPPPRPAVQVNLSGGDEEREAMLVTGDHVVPARPDGRVQNHAPAYPVEAARRGSQGLVGLTIHVTAAGSPAWVDVRVSSGDTVLDNAARDAVSAWRFQPARAGGEAVPFDFRYNIVFALNGRDRSISHGSDRPGYDARR